MTMDQAADHVEASLRMPVQGMDSFPLSRLLSGHKAIFIYGGGDMGHKAYAELQRLDIPVEGYLDRSGNTGLLPVPCYTLERLSGRDNSDVTVLLCYVGNHYDDTVAALNAIGIRDIRIPNNFFAQNQVFSEDLRKNGQMIKGSRSRIMEALRLLCDEESLDTFCGLLRAYITKDFEKHTVCQKHRTSMDPSAIAGWKHEYGSLIDCGAFIGDTLEDFFEYSAFLGSYVGFEPDLKTFGQLSSYIKSQKEKLGQAFLYPCGAGDQTGLARFEAANTVGSRLSEEGDAVVPVVKIDDVIHGGMGDGKTLLKMDVEGCEAAVLDGAESFIKEYRPDLMVCVYHKMEDLWELPLRISRMQKGYRYYLRSYTGVAVDTVLYALR